MSDTPTLTGKHLQFLTRHVTGAVRSPKAAQSKIEGADRAAKGLAGGKLEPLGTEYLSIRDRYAQIEALLDSGSLEPRQVAALEAEIDKLEARLERVSATVQGLLAKGVVG